jgi:tetratricopeptide (TPR) repeat protein
MTDINRALALHRAGRLNEAEALYRQILQSDPEQPDALHLLGIIALQTGHNDTAVDYLRKAVDRRPQVADYHYNLGLAFAGLEKPAEAAGHFRQAIALKPDFAEAYNNLGNALREQGDLEGAAHHYRRGLELDPANAALHNNLGVALHNSGSNEEAIGHYRRAIDLDPNNADTHFNLGNALYALGYWEQSVAAYERAIGLKPDLVDAYVKLATTLRRLNRFEQAEARYRQVLRLQPDLTSIYVNLGCVLEEQGRLQEAERTLTHAMELDGRSALALVSLGNVHRAHGHFRQAEAAYREALRSSSGYVDAYLHLATVKRYSSRDDDDAQNILTLLANPNIGNDDKVGLHFTLGKILDDCGAYDDAFSHYSEGNALNHRTSHFDIGQLTSHVDRIVRTFDTKFFFKRRKHGRPSELPVFIVGMPRSGTTLVEQIIASHSQVRGAGELTKIHDLAGEISVRLGIAGEYPEVVTEIDPGTSRALAADYEAYLHGRVDAGAVRVSDKMPSNFAHLGFIALLFPNARVVHCTRHPLDVSLSIYFQHFRQSYDYAHDLGDIGNFYRQYQRLMKHWHEVLPLRVHRLRYEDLVASPEQEVWALIEFLGLPWDEGCLAFHRNERPVRTASVWQVRRPLYSGGVGRWRNYERHLGPLKQALGIENQ